MTHFRELTDRYTLEKILRSSRAGTVLRAIDSRSGQALAVKTVNVTSPPLLVQKAPELEKLGAALESLREPSLPAVTDSGFTTEGSAFLVMELLEGRTLDTLTGPPQRLLALLAQAVDGLEALARRGIGHHNLSPDNLFVVGAPPAEGVKLLGLGTALFRAAGPAPAESARFRAPELQENGPADWRADLYSFALTTCQVLGITVAAGDPPSAQMPFALSLELENSEALRLILERCLRRNPAERPSHQEIRDAFRLALGGLQAPAPLPEVKPAAPKLVLSAPQLLRPMAAAVPPPAASAGPAVLASTAHATPEPVPSGDEEMLSTIDDDILNALATAPPMPVDPNAPPAGRVVPFRGAGSAAVPPPPAKANPLMKPGVLLALAAVLIVAAGGVFWWLAREGPAEPVQAEAPALPPPPPRRPAAEVLAEVEEAMADEEWPLALETLRTLNGTDLATLSPQGCRQLAALEETLGKVAVERLPVDLAQGLKTGSLGRLRFALSASEGQEEVLSEALRADLARARSILDLYAGIEEAAGRQAHLEVLERFALLEKDLPGVTDPQGVREQAAAAVEKQAEELARGGKYEDALVELDSVLRHWPKREIASERFEAYRRARQLTVEQEALLEVLPAAERRRKPHEGLEMLREVEPVPHLEAQFADIRKRLEEQLASLDQQPPQVVLRDGYFLEYDRGSVVELSFRATDDYLVRSVKLMARPEGGRMREMPLEKSTLGYSVEIPPDFHRNGVVEIYVVATDASGHEGFFGTPDLPKMMQRRRGFERMVDDIPGASRRR
jgi:hypothetical protein